MIKNATNRSINTQNTTASNIHTKSNVIVNDNDNQKTVSHQTTKPLFGNANNENKNGEQPMSKLDIIKKFDSKFKRNDSSNEVTQAKHVIASNKLIEKHLDETTEFVKDKDDFNATDELDNENEVCSNEIIGKNNQNNDNGNVGCVGVGSGIGSIVPPKPLPRTSRNNSVSSISSEQGALTANSDESIYPRPKPRTTTATAYKVFLH